MDPRRHSPHGAGRTGQGVAALNSQVVDLIPAGRPGGGSSKYIGEGRCKPHPGGPAPCGHRIDGSGSWGDHRSTPAGTPLWLATGPR
jgi:hypothetical protein